MSDALEVVGAVLVVVSLWALSPWLLGVCAGLAMVGAGYRVGRGDE